MPRVDWLSELQTSLKRSMKVKLGGQEVSAKTFHAVGRPS